MITREQREERYAKAPAAVRALYDSEESGEYLLTVFQKHNLPMEKYRAYGISIGNVILGFYPEAQLPSLLQEGLEVSADKAKEVTTDLHPFFAPIREMFEFYGQPTQPPQEAMRATPSTPKPVVGYAAAQTQDPDAVPAYKKPLTEPPQYSQ